MSYSRTDDNGKDTIHFVTADDHTSPSSDEPQGAVSATGEINWDCPCLGGMAYGPCGEQFRDAFSCFVYSETDPKGIDCVDKFQAMQDCFREHPDVYADELRDDDEDAPKEVEPAAPAADADVVADATAEETVAEANEIEEPAPVSA
ncbi:Oxidoreductase [Blastocladiella emersonii ATCC 22665]|nr:Oxidoreductase [Blastocladiella emersonii ATCC 22665]